MPKKSTKSTTFSDCFQSCFKDLNQVFAGELPSKEALASKKKSLLNLVWSEIEKIMVERGSSYSALSEDIFANFRDLQDLTFLSITRLKADRLFNSVIVDLKEGNLPNLSRNKDHLLDMIVYLILYYGFLDEREKINN